MDRQAHPRRDLNRVINPRGGPDGIKRWTAELASQSSASIASESSLALESSSLASYLSQHSGVLPAATPYPGYDSTSYYALSSTTPVSLSMQPIPTSISYSFTTITEIPVTFTLDSTTIITSTASLITAVGVSNSYPTLSSSFSGASTATSPFQAQDTQPIQAASSQQGGTCTGHGIDNSAEGVVATAVIASAVGLIIWLIFAFLRPRLPQLYAVREWFLNPDVRPRHLSRSLFSFLNPPVPMIPSMPKDTSDFGTSPATDARLFPSDEELSQRTLWIAFLIALGWTVLGLAAALPLYLVGTPCVANTTPVFKAGSAYSTMSDLSLLRLLKMLDNNSITTTSSPTSKRATVDGDNESPKAKRRLLILAVLVIVVGMIPILWKLWKEFNKAVAHRKRWLTVRCHEIELGWLSATRAPGFGGWGEGRVKNFLRENGMSAGLDRSKTPRGPRRDATNAADERVADEDGQVAIDIQGLYTIPDTHQLSLLIDRRDKALEALEVAEARYIASFRLSTPSHADFDPAESTTRREREPRQSGKYQRLTGRASSDDHVPETSSGAPTSYVAPKSYYQIPNVSHVGEDAGFSAVDPGPSSPPPLPRMGASGSRFQELEDVDRTRFSAFPADPSPASEGTPAGPNKEDPAFATDEFGQPIGHPSRGNEIEPAGRRETWPSSVVLPASHRDSNTTGGGGFRGVKTVTGHDRDLPVIYSDIRHARSALKELNAEINDMQQEAFNHIAEGTDVKGWLIFGRGIRYIPGVQMIEGRSKEDIRWKELQRGVTMGRMIMWWVIIVIIGLLLGGTLIAVVGLALADSPDLAFHLPFLRPISNADSHNFGAAIATTLVPAVVASLLIALTVFFIHYCARYSGKPAVSTMQLAEFKALFAVLVIICGVWIVVAGGLIFATDAFATSSARPATVSEGTIYIAILLMLITMNLAIISPGLLMLQPVRLWRAHRAQKKAITPRQKFRAVYPRTYNASYGMAACVLAVVFACTFAMLFPLIGPPVVILVLLTMVAQRYLVGYVFGRLGVGQTGGLLHIWVIRRFGTLLGLQPLLFGLVLLSRRQWALGGVLIGVAVFVAIGVEVYTYRKLQHTRTNQLDQPSQEALVRYKGTALRAANARNRSTKQEEGDASLSPITAQRRPRQSIASVLDMISLSLAVMPSTSRVRGPIPLDTEGIDDLVSTERAARTRPNPLPRVEFHDRAEETAGMLYPPELLAPTPTVWLPDDPNGVGRSEAYDLQRYHGLEITLQAEDTRRARVAAGRRRSSLSTPP